MYLRYTPGIYFSFISPPDTNSVLVLSRITRNVSQDWAKDATRGEQTDVRISISFR